MSRQTVDGCLAVKEVSNQHHHSGSEPQRPLLCSWCCGNDLKVLLDERSTRERDCPSSCWCVLFPFLYVVCSEDWLLQQQVMIFFSMFLTIVVGNRFSGLCLVAKTGAIQQKHYFLITEFVWVCVCACVCSSMHRLIVTLPMLFRRCRMSRLVATGCWCTPLGFYTMTEAGHQ